MGINHLPVNSAWKQGHWACSSRLGLLRGSTFLHAKIESRWFGHCVAQACHAVRVTLMPAPARHPNTTTGAKESGTHWLSTCLYARWQAPQTARQRLSPATPHVCPESPGPAPHRPPLPGPVQTEQRSPPEHPSPASSRSSAATAAPQLADRRSAATGPDR